MEDATPRVNFETMQRYHGKKVILCCQINQIDNGQVRVLTSDKGEVTVVGATSPYEGRFAEIVGTVLSPNTVQEGEHTNLCDTFSKLMIGMPVRLGTKLEFTPLFAL